ncbi:uncharacterized protein BDV14DRAFT_125439 [Aspergillus stella-maris]|uniref:uncharacterized protein n=1 Tax=Aspergillus stella-maris TaxID=1810926 RepID=UPI003CCE0C50
MGSSLSLQSKDKRRRSNRLSKPPQIQATQGCSNGPSARHSPDQALSLPTTPTTWQDPWAGTSVTVSPRETVSQNPRSQSFSAKPLRHETGWRSNGFPVAHRSIQSTADIWPQSPTSPTPAPSRRGSMYGRASFQLSETAAFQPTTLQSNPQSQLIGQPRRSYSVHSPSLNAKKNVDRRTIDRFASLNSHSRVNNQEALPIRRRSLLMRPGVATRKATRDVPCTILSESRQADFISPNSDNTFLDPHHASHPIQGDVIANNSGTRSRIRPPTPSDFEYSHLGTIKLGTLRVVNGSASPCPSDRTRLSPPDNTTPETMRDSASSARLPSPAGNDTHNLRPMSPDELDVYRKYYPLLENAEGVDHTMDTLPLETKARQTTSARNGLPATILNIPSLSTMKHDTDYPASPYSFEKSPTSLSSHQMGLCEIEDEGISIHGKNRGLASLPEKVPERHLSYSSCASSHRRADSGYSSAASHRNSIDSHASLRRSPGFRKLAFAESSREIESEKSNTLPMITSQNVMTQLSYIRGRPMSMTRMHRERTQNQITGRTRGSSLPTPAVPNQAPPLPIYCAQLRSTDPPDSTGPYSFTSDVLHHGNGQFNNPLYMNHEGNPAFVFPESVSQGNGVLASVATHPYRRHTSGVKSDPWLAVSENGLPRCEISSQPPRGRTRSRSIGYLHRTAFELY